MLAMLVPGGICEQYSPSAPSFGSCMGCCGLVIELCFRVCPNDGLGSFVGWSIFIFSSSPLGKAVGNLLGCLYVGCVGCGAARSLLLFGYVLVLCSEPLDLHFISFLCLRIVVTACGQVIEVHRCCCPGGLLGGLGAWRGGSGGHISKRGCGLGWSFYFVSFCFLCIEAATGNLGDFPQLY